MMCAVAVRIIRPAVNNISTLVRHIDIESVMDRSRFRPAPGPVPASLSRRRFVHGLSGVLLATGLRQSGWAAAPADDGSVLSGTDFNLEVGSREVNFTGARRLATAINGHVPGPLLRWREGDTITLRVANRLAVPTSLHWHGVIVPADMDGVRD